MEKERKELVNPSKNQTNVEYTMEEIYRQINR